MSEQTRIVPAALGQLPADNVFITRQSVAMDDARVINDLFAVIRALCPAWKQAWPNRATYQLAKNEWLEAFKAAGLSRVEFLRYGLDALRDKGHDFVPNPGAFIDLCIPEPHLLGLPGYEQAFRQACRKAHPAAAEAWRHRAVYHAAVEVGLFAFRTIRTEQDTERVRRSFFKAYREALRLVMTGAPLKAIPAGELPEPRREPNRELGAQALAELRRMLRKRAYL